MRRSSPFMPWVMGAITLLSPVLAQPAWAQHSCDDAKHVEDLPRPPNGCHRERITASGHQRPTIAWAQRAAEDAWKDQVLTKFGERFRVFSNAACARQECVPGSIAGMYRCTYVGYPCAVRPTYSSGELSTSEIEEMQRLLARKNYAVTVDGKFGPKTQEALERWQRRIGIDADGMPTRANLEKLRTSRTS